MSATPPPSIGQPPAARWWFYRTLLVLVVPALFGLGLEGVLHLAGFGHSAHFLIPDTQPGYYRTNPDFVSRFMPGGFDLRPLNFRVTRHKPADTVRIVVLGESAAQGVPEPLFAFAPQLRAQLRARYPGKNIEVLNTGIVAINSHVIYQIARDLADLSPDLFVVYMGNNEIVGPYGPGCAYLSAMPPLALIRLSGFIRSTRTGQLLGAGLARLPRPGATPAEWGGMAMFTESAVRGDDPRLEKSYRYFAQNLEDIVDVATSAGAKTMLCTVVSNLKDSPPLLSLHRPDLVGAELSAWEKAFAAGRLRWLLEENDPARTALIEAGRLDPQYADTWFMLGSIELQAGNVSAAREYFLAAQHWDALRFRPDGRINEIIREVARRHENVRLIDAARQLGSDAAATAEPAGREVLFEHVHLDWAGNYQLGLAMAQAAETMLPPTGTPRPPWLDAAACAAAVGYTPPGRAGVLLQVASITQNPPFTNQLTYPEDMARSVRDLGRAKAAATPATLRAAWNAVRAMIERDPENPHLEKIAKELADDLGENDAALQHIRRARQLQPATIRQEGLEAMLLIKQGRFAEAEQQLRETARHCPGSELATIAPAYVNFYIRTQRVPEGLAILDDFMTRSPGNPKLAFFRHKLLVAAGEKAGAEDGFRALLAKDPGNQAAQESLVELLQEQGKMAEAAEASRSAAPAQARNQANNLRAAAAAEARGDEADAVAWLRAAERSGPVPAALELRLARKLYGQGQRDEALLHLAWARRISRYEGNPAVTESISAFIAQMEAAR